MNYKGINKDNGYFDDCPICQAMRKMGIRQKTINDGEGVSYITPLHPKQASILKAAFGNAVKRGGVTGGFWQDI